MSSEAGNIYLAIVQRYDFVLVKFIFYDYRSLSMYGNRFRFLSAARFTKGRDNKVEHEKGITRRQNVNEHILGKTRPDDL